MGRRASVQAPVGDPTIEDLAASWARHLRAAPYSARTLDVYARAMATLLQFLKDQGMPLTARAVTREHIEAFVAARLAGVNAHTGRALRPATARVEYAALLRFWAWAVEEGEIAVSPMVHIVAPRIVVDPVRVLTEAELAALLKTCDGASFRQRRDMALLRLLIDTGMRRAECAALTLAAVDLEQDVARVLGKGGKWRTCPFGKRTARALDRYLRLRVRAPQAEEPALWVGYHGALKAPTIAAIVEARGRKAGLEELHPHMLRHTWAHAFLAHGGQEGDLMRLAGWSSRTMLGRYGASGADARAREAARQHSLGDRL